MKAQPLAGLDATAAASSWPGCTGGTAGLLGLLALLAGT
jgi:hypothetical protein